MTTGSLTAGLSLADTDAAIAALETDVAALETEDLLLGRNVRTVVTVDMNNSDYTLTDDEANSALLIVTNTGDGTKTLTWPTTSDSTRPAQQLVVTLLASTAVTGAAESGGGTCILGAGDIHLVTVPDGLGAFDVNLYIQTNGRKSSNGVVEVATGADYDFTSNDAGKLIVGVDANPQNFNINADLSGIQFNAVIDFMNRGAGLATIVAGVGVTLYGDLTVAQNESRKIWLEGSSNTWYVA